MPKLRFILFGLFLAFAANAFISNITFASVGLKVSPVKQEVDVEPGTVKKGSLNITNLGDKSVAVDLSAEEFSVVNENYDYAFSTESDVAKWVSFDDSKITILGNQSLNVNYAVNVPSSAEPGGRYISIFASTESSVDIGIESRQRVASLLYITVLGDISRSGDIINLSSPWLVFDSGDWSASLQNTGTAHYVSRIDVNVLNLTNNKIVASGSREAMILPGTIRLVTDKLPQLKWPGIYKIVYQISLGDKSSADEVRYVLYLPPMAIALIVIILTIFLIVFSSHRRKKVI
jgi:hypothetical protein